jgi:hypothetical protein
MINLIGFLPPFQEREEFLLRDLIETVGPKAGSRK